MGKFGDIELGEEVNEYLQLKKKSTRETYRINLKRFLDWYKMEHGEEVGFSHLLDRLDEELRKPRRERKKLAELIYSRYIDYLLEKDYSNYTVRNNFSAYQNLLKYRGYPCSGRWIGNMPHAVGKKENNKHRWTLEEIRKFVEAAPSYRDKAAILVMFQSGMAAKELIDLDYGDVRKELEGGKLPLKLEMVREKTGVRYVTFLGADAVKHLDLYLETRGDLEEGSPLFTKIGSKERLKSRTLEWRFREIADEASFVDLKEDSMNPARPHSMRSAFKSRLTGSMDRDLVEFFMGHKLSDTTKAYLNMPIEELRETYAKFEHLLSIETTSKDVIAGREREKEGEAPPHILEAYQERLAELEGRNKAMEKMIEKEIDRRREVEETITSLKKQNKQLKNRIISIEQFWDLNKGTKEEKQAKREFLKAWKQFQAEWLENRLKEEKPQPTDNQDQDITPDKKAEAEDKAP